LTALQDKQKHYESDSAKDTIRFDQLVLDKRNADDSVSQLSLDNKNLQSVIDSLQLGTCLIKRLTIDYSELKDSNRNMSQQWEDAVEAMSKRDAVLQNSQMTNTKLRQQVMDYDTETRKLHVEMQTSTKNKIAVEKGTHIQSALMVENAEYLQLLLESRDRIMTLEEKERVSTISQEHSSRLETKTVMQIEKMKKKLEIAEDHVDVKDQTVSELTHRIKSMKLEHESRVALTLTKVSLSQ